MGQEPPPTAELRGSAGVPSPLSEKLLAFVTVVTHGVKQILLAIYIERVENQFLARGKLAKSDMFLNNLSIWLDDLAAEADLVVLIRQLFTVTARWKLFPVERLEITVHLGEILQTARRSCIQIYNK